MKERLGYIDFLKGVSILAILYSHILKDSSNGYIMELNSFFMVMIFYTMVGWTTFNNQKDNFNMKDFLQRKLRLLGIPYLLFSSIIILVDIPLIVLKYYLPKQIIQDIYRTICFAGIGTLWFIPTLFIAELLLYYTVSKGKKYLVKSLFIILPLTVIGVYILNGLRSDSLIFDVLSAPIIALIKGLCGFVFSGFGYLSCQTLLTHSKSKLINNIAILFLPICLGLVFVVPSGDFNHLVLTNPISWMLLSFLLCISLIVSSKTIYNFLSIFIIIRIVDYFGKNSLVLMCTHYSILLPILSYMLNKITRENASVKSPYDLILLISITLLQPLLIFLIKNYFPVLIGKQKNSQKILFNS